MYRITCGLINSWQWVIDYYCNNKILLALSSICYLFVLEFNREKAHYTSAKL